MKDYHAIVDLWDEKVHFGGSDSIDVPFAKVPCTCGQNLVILHCASTMSYDTVIKSLDLSQRVFHQNNIVKIKVSKVIENHLCDYFTQLFVTSKSFHSLLKTCFLFTEYEDKINLYTFTFTGTCFANVQDNTTMIGKYKPVLLRDSKTNICYDAS